MSQKKSGGRISAPFQKSVSVGYPLALIEFLLASLLLTTTVLIFQGHSQNQKLTDIENQLIDVRVQISNIHGIITRGN